MMEDFIGAYGNRLILAVVGVGVALLLTALGMAIARRRSGASPFIRGGRNRQPRLQVLDATAVDARRRLVLVRRDDVEHLVMIGGPTDIVIESRIGAAAWADEPGKAANATLFPASEAVPLTNEGDVAVVHAPQPVAQPEAPSMAAVPPIPRAESPQLVTRAEPPRLTPASVAPQRAAAPQGAPVASFSTPAPPEMSPPPPLATTAAPARPLREAHHPTRRDITAATGSSDDAAPIPQSALFSEAHRLFEPAPAPAIAHGRPQSAAQDSERRSMLARQPVVDRRSAGDLLDAARERVLPGLKPPAVEAVPPLAAAPRQATAEAAPRREADLNFGDQLANDFESFLEAEIAKSHPVEAPALGSAAEPRLQSLAAPITGATPDGDMQKEMARIFGEMSAKREI